jgi:hypothetical protein
MGPRPPKVRRFSAALKRALARIQAHRRIERVGAHLAAERDMKCAAGKGLKEVRKGDGAGTNGL